MHLITDPFVENYITPLTNRYVSVDRYREAVDSSITTIANIAVSYIPKCLGGDSYIELRKGHSNFYRKTIQLALIPLGLLAKSKVVYNIVYSKITEQVEVKSKIVASFVFKHTLEWLIDELIPVVIAIALPIIGSYFTLDHLNEHNYLINNPILKGIDHVIQTYIFRSNILLYIVLAIKLTQLASAIIDYVSNQMRWDRDWIGQKLGIFIGDAAWPILRDFKFLGIQITEKK